MELDKEKLLRKFMDRPIAYDTGADVFVKDVIDSERKLGDLCIDLVTDDAQIAPAGFEFFRDFVGVDKMIELAKAGAIGQYGPKGKMYFEDIEFSLPEILGLLERTDAEIKEHQRRNEEISRRQS